jgi:hypothetical protein
VTRKKLALPILKKGMMLLLFKRCHFVLGYFWIITRATTRNIPAGANISLYFVARIIKNKMINIAGKRYMGFLLW